MTPAGQPPRMFGPYQTERQIGAGGMGVVYQARHCSTGEAVALKSVRLRSPELLAAFRREIHALSMLRHPGIVRILDHGSLGDAPWYAMELVEGQPLSKYLTRIHPERLAAASTCNSDAVLATAEATLADNATSQGATPIASWRDCLPLTRAICRALSFLHGHGLVHRDLKPENILIQPDSSPVLVDFGLVAQFGAAGREVLEFADAGGTFGYMAPEQWFGRLVDARADLYSLGCILYECVCGVPPFGASGMQGLTGTTAIPPSARNPEIGPDFDAMMGRLLARDPKDRIGYADDVESALAYIEGISAGITARRSVYLYRSDLAGREAVLSRMTSALGNAMASQPSVLLVTSESGGGKTRLAMELATLAADRQMTVITGDCPPVSGGSDDVSGLGAPLRPFRQFLLTVADQCRGPGEAAARWRLFSKRFRLLAAYEPSLAELMGDGDPDPNQGLSVEAARTRLFQTLGGLIVDYAREQPLLLVLDDLQWADDLSLDFLAWLASADEAAVGRYLVVATCRVEEMGEGIQAIAGKPRASREILPYFDRAAVRKMVGGMLALADPPESLVDFVADDSHGNPFFIAEYLRAAIYAGLLRRDGAGRWRLAFAGQSAELRDRIMPPATISALVALRLKDLDPEATHVLGAAAVLGREFDVELVARTADCALSAVLGAYAVLSPRHILEEDSAGVSRFAHDKLREIAYAGIAANARPELHRRAAAALEDRYAGKALTTHLGELGYHHAKGGSAQRSADYYQRAGDRARETYSNRDALRFYQLALEQLEGGLGQDATFESQRLRIRERAGDAMLLLARPAEARALFAQALAGLEPSSSALERVRCQRKIAQTWEREHRHVDALGAYADAERELGKAPPSESWAAEWWYEYVQIQVDKAWDLYFSARVQELGALVEQVRPAVMQHATPVQKARFLQALVQAAAKRDRLRIRDETLEHSRAQLAAADVSGDLRELATARFTRAFVLSMRGLDEEAEPLFVAAIEDACRLDDALLRTRFESYYAITHRRLGRQTEARRAAESLLAYAEERGMLDYVGVARANLAWCDWRADRHADAERHANDALAAWDKLRPGYVYPLQWLARMPLSACLHSARKTDETLEHWRRMLEEPQQLLPDELEQSIRSAFARPNPSSIEAVMEAAGRYRLL